MPTDAQWLNQIYACGRDVNRVAMMLRKLEADMHAQDPDCNDDEPLNIGQLRARAEFLIETIYGRTP